MKASSFNIIVRLQRWMDSVPGQTFLNYAYSWGASIVILGALFKLTHLYGADIMLFIGMGTEVVVFFLSAFDRPFDKTNDTPDLNLEGSDEEDEESATAETPAAAVGTGAGTTVIIGGGSAAGGYAPAAEGGASAGEGAAVAAASGAAPAVQGTGVVLAAAGSPAATLTDAQNAANPDLGDATQNYVDKLRELTEVLTKVEEQSRKMTTDSEEMINLNRTLTGINTVYELQLKNISSQIGTIDRINEQTRRMAAQIEELNGVYDRMIKALTVNMRNAAGAAAPTQGEGGSN